MKRLVQPPNGGYGWVVVFGVALTNAFNQSLLSVFGLLFKDQLDEMGQNTTTIALVLNLNTIILNFTGFFTKQLINNFSLRKIAIFGNLMFGVGICLTAQVSTFTYFILFYSVFVGFGLGLMNSSGFLMINLYFERNRGKALGLSMAGTGLGQMIMPFVTKYLLDEFGNQGAGLIIGALSFHGLVGASFYKPPTVAPNLTGSERQHLLPSSSSETLNEESSNLEEETSFTEKISNMLDLKLLKDNSFLNIIFGISFIYTVSINFSLLFPYFLEETVQLDRNNVALCMSVLAGMDLVSRLTVPSVTDKLGISARSTLTCGLILLILARFLLAESHKLTEIIIIAAFFGFTRATTVINQNLCLAEYCSGNKSHYLASAVGLAMITKGLCVISLGQVLGVIRDLSNSYSICFHFQNLILSIVVCFWLSEIIYTKYCKKQEIDDTSNKSQVVI